MFQTAHNSKEEEVIEEEIIAADESDELVPRPEPAIELLPAVVRSEVNFLQFPFFALSWRGLKKKIETVYTVEEERNGQKVKIEWRVMANAKLGHPTPFDGRVRYAIDALIGETLGRSDYPLVNPLQFSIYHLAKLMGFAYENSRVYRDIKNSLTRIALTGIESKGAFYLKDDEAWVHDVFHLYDRVVFKGRKMPDGTIAETNYLWLSEPYLHNLNARYVKPLDYHYLINLKRDLARRIYEILGAKFYGLRGKHDSQNYLRIGYLNLCQTLPITPQNSYSHAKRVLDPAHEELMGKQGDGFLSRVVYQRYKDKKDFNIIYYPGKRAIAEQNGDLERRGRIIPTVEQLLLPLLEEREKDAPPQLTGIAKELHDRGISRAVAIKLCQNYPEERIREKISMHDEMKTIGELKENAAGYLRSAIEGDYQLSEEQERKIKARVRRKEQEERREQIAQLEEVKKGIEEMRSIARDDMVSIIISENASVIETAAAKIQEPHTQGRMTEYGSAQEAYQKSPMFRFAIQKILREEMYRERFEEAEKTFNERIAAIESQILTLKKKVE